VTIRFRVHGRVQGVGYRWFIARHAVNLRLTGCARNLADGTVEVTAQGAAESIDALEEWIRRGPEFAEVTDVEKAEILDDVELYKTFDVM
jgi:acylphosphatase